MSKKLILMLFLIFSFTSFSQNKKAFLLGVGEYLHKNNDTIKGWNTISGDKDLDYIKENLLMPLSFMENDITVLKNKQVVRDNVIKQIKQFTQSIDSTDFVFMYFSTHGQQISDLNGDEKKDHFDESLVLYDTPYKSIGYRYRKGGYYGQKHLTDDSLGVYIARIRKRLNSKGHLFLGIDACFSGTGDKAGGISRGAEDSLVIVDRKRISESFSYDNADLNELKGNDDELGSYVFIAAASSKQKSYQYSDSLSSLSYAIVEAYNKAMKNENVSYEYFFKRYLHDAFKKNIREKNNRNQVPVIYGDIKHPVFNNYHNIPIKDIYFSTYINKINKNDGNYTISFPYGKIHGITDGVLFKIIDKSNPKVIAYAKTVASNETESVLMIDRKVRLSTLNFAVFIPVKLNYLTDFKIRIYKSWQKKLVKKTLKLKTIKHIVGKESDFELSINKEKTFFSVIHAELGVIVNHQPINNLRHSLIYASYIKYLLELTKRSKSKIISDVSLINSLGYSLLNNETDSNFYYNIAFISDIFEVKYPNAQKRNIDLYLRKNKYEYFSLINEHNVIVLFKKVGKNEDYQNKLKIDESIFNQDYFSINFLDNILFNNNRKYKITNDKSIFVKIFKMTD